MVTRTDTWQHQYIRTNNVNLHYVTQGEGELMLMLHGFPEFWYSWRHQIPEFAKQYKVVALDLRGYNDSDKPSELASYRMANLVEDIKGVILALGYSRCILVGHDWGGAIAWCFAYAYPELLSKLIVLNLPHPAKFAAGLRLPQQFLRSWYIAFFQLPALPELILQANHCEAIAQALKGTATRKSAFSDADLQAYRDAAAKPGALTAMLNYYRNFNHFPLHENWEVLSVTTLMIWGEQDTALDKLLTYGTADYVRDFQIKYIVNSGHWVQQEQPDLVNQYMWEFLNREQVKE